jgi:hypothetical protein
MADNLRGAQGVPSSAARPSWAQPLERQVRVVEQEPPPVAFAGPEPAALQAWVRVAGPVAPFLAPVLAAHTQGQSAPQC